MRGGGRRMNRALTICVVSAGASLGIALIALAAPGPLVGITAAIFVISVAWLFISILAYPFLKRWTQRLDQEQEIMR